MTFYQVSALILQFLVLVALLWCGYSLYELTAVMRMGIRRSPHIPDDPADDDRPAAEQKNDDPVRMDPQHPPYATTYRPVSGAPAPTCHCHKPPRQIQVGQQVMMWPIPGTDGAQFWVFCEDK
jgi:hypothetical protein